MDAALAIFWECECKMRILTSGLTSKEESDLFDLRPNSTERTAIRYFGDTDSEEIMASWVSRHLAENGFRVHGQGLVSIKDPAFSLLKGLMMSMINNPKNKMHANCNCICQLYFMPAGCGCTSSAVQGKAVAKANGFWKEGMLLCHKHATCIRCGKLLVCISTMVESPGCAIWIHQWCLGCQPSLPQVLQIIAEAHQ